MGSIKEVEVVVSGLCVNLVFLQSDLTHLPVADEGAHHLVNPLSRSHSDDIVGRYEARSVSNLPLLKQML